MQLARVAQKTWAFESVASRCHVLAKLRHLIACESDHIATVISSETGKPMLDALSGDILVTLEQPRFCEAHLHRLLKARKVDKPFFLYRGAHFSETFEPYGVVIIYSPSNYPFNSLSCR